MIFVEAKTKSITLSAPHLAKELEPSSPQTAPEILKQFSTKSKRSRDEIPDIPNIYGFRHEALPTKTIMKLAKERLIQLNSKKADILSSLKGGFGPDESVLSSEVAKDLELALLIQAAAEKVANQEYICAIKLLGICDSSASKTGNPVQRLVYYFSEALKERINQEWGIMSLTKLEGKECKLMAEEMDRNIALEPAIVESQQELPFCIETQIITTQSILESVALARRVHLVDFEIDNGSQWILIMQAFAARREFPLEHLNITAVGTCRVIMEETGKRLSSFAESISLPFSYKVVESNLKDLKEKFFELEAGEVVAIDLAYRLWSLLAWPSHLFSLIRVIQNLNPRLVVLKELEVKTNTPIFLERFNESLILFCAMFDCTKACMEHHVVSRKLVEEVHFCEMIRNFVTTEGTEKALRHEKISFWRALLGKFGLVETDLSPTSLHQANLSFNSCDRFSSCTTKMDGKCLILGWNGTPIQSISAWKLLFR